MAPPRGVPQPGKKTRMRISMSTYNELVDAFRLAPGNFSAAARHTGYDRHACKYVWERGWQRRGLTLAKPIKDVVGEEKDFARREHLERVKRERELADAADAATKAAIRESLVQEQTLMTETRRGLVALAETIRMMARVTPAFALIVQNAVATVGPDGRLVPIANPTVTPMQAMKILRELSTMSSRVSYAAAAYLEIARADRQVSGADISADEVDDPAEILEELSAVASLTRRLEEAGFGVDETPPGIPPSTTH